MKNQFTAKRMIGLGLLTAATLAWMWYMVVEKPPVGAAPAPDRDAWSEYIPHAIVSIALVVVVDILIIVAMRRRQARLSDEEKDPIGPRPHLDADVSPEALSASPVTRAALRRTINKQPHETS